MISPRLSLALVFLGMLASGCVSRHETPVVDAPVAVAPMAGDGTAVAQEEPPVVVPSPVVTPPPPPPVPAGRALVAAGVRVPVSTRVVLWDEEAGFDGNTPGPEGVRFGQRVVADPVLAEEVAAKGWNRERLARQVDQLVLHFDGCCTSRQCAGVLEDRGLSVHFLLDADGTIYQALDLAARAWHATIANDRAIGIEIANPGAVAEVKAKDFLARFYTTTADGWPMLSPPAGPDPAWPVEFVPRPARRELVLGPVQREKLAQYDFTPQQYEALARLLAALHREFPKIALDYPHNADGSVKTAQLSPAEFASFHGVLGHYHVQGNKIDPGPAMQWAWLIARAKEVGAEGVKAAPKEAAGKPVEVPKEEPKEKPKPAEVAPAPMAAQDENPKE